MSNDTTTVQDVQQAQFRAYTPPTETGYRYNVQLTVNGATAAKLVTAIEQFTAALDAGGWAPAYGFEGPNGQGRGAHTNGNGHTAPAAAPAQTVADHGPMPGFEDCEWIVVNIPRDGKQKVEFWREGRKYAEESVTHKPEEIGKLLAPLGLDATPAEHKPFPVRVHYTIGRERPRREDGSHGGWYHDITRLEVLPPA